jgi:hypothetical protein
VLKHPLDLPWVVPDKSALCQAHSLLSQLQAAATARNGTSPVADPSILAASKLHAVRRIDRHASNRVSLDLLMFESF